GGRGGGGGGGAGGSRRALPSASRYLKAWMMQSSHIADRGRPSTVTCSRSRTGRDSPKYTMSWVSPSALGVSFGVSPPAADQQAARTARHTRRFMGRVSFRRE